MTLADRLIFAFWFVLVVYWLVMAVGAKRTVGARFGWRQNGPRVAIIVLILLALRLPVFGRAEPSGWLPAGSARVVAGLVGVGLCALGVGLAVWARACLGRNWGMPMTRKADPGLVTAGPYVYARHPIYGGLLLAMLGSAIGQNLFWTVPLVLYAAYFLYSARREETLMTEQFPGRYPDYMQRTTMFLPFLF
ncbi:MAG: isoprenylcysteine carboxylmethyltransferase family protein [Proteobacteria bacterium]|nr:isoprenylcysteine carboxylmethyltransferase family protein [Pseudomonadota bacterium]